MTRVSVIRRIWFSLVAVCAGDMVLLASLLVNALLLRHALLVAHIGEPHRMVPQAVQSFVIYAVMSFFGWILVGLPVAAFVSQRLIVRLPWAVAILAGAALGPVAVVLLTAGLTRHLNFAHMQWYFVVSILVSTVAFVVYRLLLARVTQESIPR